MADSKDKFEVINGRTPEPSVDVVQDGIANKLREFYSSIESEGVPDNIVHLLDKLDQVEKAQAGKARREGNANE